MSTRPSNLRYYTRGEVKGKGKFLLRKSIAFSQETVVSLQWSDLSVFSTLRFLP